MSAEGGEEGTVPTWPATNVNLGNQGIQQFGGNGTVEAGQLAVGAGARVVQATPAPDDRPELEEVVELLRRLEVALDQHAGGLPGVDAVRRDGSALAEELTSRRPDRLRVAELLGRITGGVQTAGALTLAAGALADAVRKLAL